MPRPFILPNNQYLDGNGDPLAGGMIYTYVANSNTPKVTYADPDGVSPNSNPIVLDADGRATFYGGSGLYKLVLTDADGVEIFSIDDVDCNPTDASDGVDGKSILNGTGAPDDGFGNDGDFYLDTSVMEIYGPKSSGEWPTPGTSLKGENGEGVPTGGTAGQLLSKVDGTDFNAEWIDPPESLPPGGTSGQILTKQSSDEGDADWENPPSGGDNEQEAPSGLVNGSNVNFTLSKMPVNSKSVKLTWDGLLYRQGPGLDYEISGKDITMAVAPVLGQEPWAVYSTEE